MGRLHRIWWYLRHEALGLFEILLGIAGFLSLATMPVLGSLLLAAGGALLARDVLLLARPARSMEVTAPAPGPWSSIVPDGPGAVLLERGDSAALTWPDLDTALATTPVPIERMEREFRLDPIAESVAPGVVWLKRRQGKPQLVNDAKVRLVGPLTEESVAIGRPVRTQATDYFSSLVTNELSFRTVVVGDVEVYDGTSMFLGLGSQLRTLEQSRCSNHLGVSVMAFTSDHQVVLVRQGDRSLVNAGRVAPAGSGSVDEADVPTGQTTLQDIAIRAMRRELSEECGIQPSDIAGTWVTGYARLLERGGKPELLGVAVLNVPADSLRRTAAERGYVAQLVAEPVDVSSPEALLASLAEVSAAKPRLTTQWTLCELALGRQRRTGVLDAVLVELNRWPDAVASSPSSAAEDGR